MFEKTGDGERWRKNRGKEAAETGSAYQKAAMPSRHDGDLLSSEGFQYGFADFLRAQAIVVKQLLGLARLAKAVRNADFAKASAMRRHDRGHRVAKPADDGVLFDGKKRHLPRQAADRTSRTDKIRPREMSL